MNKRRGSILTFGLITGFTFMSYVLIGTLSWHVRFLRFEFLKMIASYYGNSGNTFIGIVWGILWSFGDGFLLGITFALIYRYFCSNIRKD
jgi:hypothetical protein